MRLTDISIASAWYALGGGKLRGNRGQAFWRKGDGWSVALDPAKGIWFDHRDGKGGGVLHLVRMVLGCDQHTALAWLQQNAGLDPQRPLLAREFTLQRKRREHAATEADRIQQWRAGLLPVLEQAKIAALERFLANPEDHLLGCFHESACIALGITEQLHGIALIDAYHNVMTKDPEYVEDLISAARTDQLQAEFCTAMVVAIMAAKETV